MRMQRLNGLLCDVMEINVFSFRYRQVVVFGQTIGNTCFCFKNILPPILQVNRLLERTKLVLSGVRI